MDNRAEGTNGRHCDEQPLSSQGYLEVREVQYTNEAKGRGVFAVKSIPKGALVELSHSIVFPHNEYNEHLKHTKLEHYLFGGTGVQGSVANNMSWIWIIGNSPLWTVLSMFLTGDMMLPLGFGSLFNHSQSPNIDYRVDFGESVIRYFACKDILAHSELFIYYGAKLWFTDGLQEEEREG